MGRRAGRLAAALLPAVFWLLVWQLAAMLIAAGRRGGDLLLPAPLSVLRALVGLIGEPDFRLAVLCSLLRVLAGMGLGVLSGALAAALTCAVPLGDRLLSPALRALRAVPVASFILLVLLWTRRDFVPAVTAALLVAPVVWEALLQGLRAADPQLLELARACRWSAFKTARLVRLPALRPALSASLTNAMGLAWKSATAAEVLCLPKRAAGTRIYYAKLYLETPELLACTLVIVLLSLALERLLRRLLTPRETIS